MFLTTFIIIHFQILLYYIKQFLLQIPFYQIKCIVIVTQPFVPIFNSHSGHRIDRFLISDLNRSWNEVQKLIRNGEINVNNKKIKDHQFVLKEGDVVTYWDKLKKQEDTQLRPIPNIQAYEELKKMILYENDQIIILNKKHGYASQGGATPNYNIQIIQFSYDQYQKSQIYILKTSTLFIDQINQHLAF